MDLFDSTYMSLDSALGAAGLRHQALANNIANVNTPGFKRSDVQFDGLLAKALDQSEASGDSSAIKNLKPATQMDETTTMRADGSNVDIDLEMANLAENNVRYNALVQLAAKKIHMLEYIISDGRK